MSKISRSRPETRPDARIFSCANLPADAAFVATSIPASPTEKTIVKKLALVLLTVTAMTAVAGCGSAPLACYSPTSEACTRKLNDANARELVRRERARADFLITLQRMRAEAAAKDDAK